MVSKLAGLATMRVVMASTSILSQATAGKSLATDVEGCAVNGFEHRRETALRIEVGGRRDAQAAGEGGGEVGEDVGVKICGHDGVQACGLGDHARGHGVDEHFVPGDGGKILCHFGCDLVPQDHAVALRVGLGDNREQLSRPRLCKFESEAHDA